MASGGKLQFHGIQTVGKLRGANTPDGRNHLISPYRCRTRRGMVKQNTTAQGNAVMFGCYFKSDDCNTEHEFAVTNDGRFQTFPFTTSVEITGDTDDGRIWGYNGNYDTARSTSFGFSTSEKSMSVGQTLGYLINRGFLIFDTSSLVSATITDIKLKMGVSESTAYIPFDIRIHKYNWDNPIGAGNREANYDGALIATLDQVLFTASSGMAGYYTSPSLDTTWINKTGYTKYALVSSRDVSGNAPTSPNLVIFNATGGNNPPKLIVEYEL